AQPRLQAVARADPGPDPGMPGIPLAPDHCMTHSLSLVCNDFDLDFGVDHQRRLRGRSGRLVLREEFGVDAVEGPEVTRVIEPHGGLDDVFQRASGERERLLDVFQRLARLRLDAARHHLTVVAHRDLPRHEHERPGLDRRRERQRLPAGTGACASQEFDAHWILRWCRSEYIRTWYQKPPNRANEFAPTGSCG